MKALITGANGQLGQELQEYLKESAVAFTAYDSTDMNILDKHKVMDAIKRDQPTIVFHCAAYTAVDKAEDEGKEMNWAVNVEGTANVAEACKAKDTPMVYISTDYVFDGETENHYTEDDVTNPKNEYGKAKLAGEEKVKEILKKYYIIRTSWVFGAYGNNFVYTMKRLAKERKRLTVINDQRGRPTWTRTLAEFMFYLVNSKQPYGVYNLSNEGSCSWYEFAEEILKDEPTEIDPITSDDYPQKAKRPKHSILDLSKAHATGFLLLSWKEALNLFNQQIEK